MNPHVKPVMPNPWLHHVRRGFCGGIWTETCDSTSRREVVRECKDVEKLRAYIAWPGTQATVRKLAIKRLNALQSTRKPKQLENWKEAT